MTKNKPQKNKLGTISHITSTNKIIVPSKKTPRIGSTILNKDNKKIGKISDIFGSTKKPYLSINHKYKKANPGETVYLSTQNKNRRKKHGRNSKKKKTIR